MEQFMQFITENIGGVMTVLGSSAVLQTAISLLVAVIMKIRNSKVTKAYMAELQADSASEFETKLAESRELLTAAFMAALASATSLAVQTLRDDTSASNKTALVNVNAYIETILSAEGNEQLRIDYEAFRAPLAKSARYRADNFDERLTAALGTAKTPPTTVETVMPQNEPTDPVTPVTEPAAPADEGDDEVIEYDV